MRIGEVAAKAGVSVQAVRYYERRGLIDEVRVYNRALSQIEVQQDRSTPLNH
jgi:DNA-binding transcriptional MerR regulator